MTWNATESAFDFVKLDYEQKKRKSEEVSQKIPNLDLLSPPEIELALEKASLAYFIDPGNN